MTRTATWPYRIRPAVADDAPVLLDLVRALAEYERLSHEVSASADLFRKHGFGRESRFEALLAEDASGEAIAFALYFFKFSTFAGKPTLHLEDLFVKSEHRGRGLGKAFFGELAAIAAERGCGRMEWDVLDWNEPAIRFYESLGAAPLRDWFTFRLTEDGFATLDSLRREGGVR